MNRNSELFARAKEIIPGGVNSPVRAFGPVGGEPPFIVSGSGCRVTDANGKSYIDYVGSWGALILGHAAPQVVAAVKAAAEKGTSFGAPTEAETELAALIRVLVPNIEMVRLVCSGTEATMTAIRLARGATKRDVLIKFDGCYHGHADSFLVAAGSGAATHGSPSSPGVPAALAALTLSVPYNDLAAVEHIFRARGMEIAAVIVEPVAGNMGCVAPAAGFLAGLRALTAKYGALLIFDEVMTGFRVHPRSAQGMYNVRPDLTTLGKIMGGGMPIGAVGGDRAIMSLLSPAGAIYQAGTLAGNPISVAAGLATLRVLKEDERRIYAELELKATRLVDGLSRALKARGIAHQAQRVGAMFCIYFSETPVRNFADAKRANQEVFKKFFHGMLAAGIYLAPSPYEAGFLSAAHDNDAIDATIEAARKAFA